MGTNDTGELCGVVQALLWLSHCAADTGAAVICCDSCYAMDCVEEKMTVTANLELIELARRLLAAVRERRTVVFVHVLGHSEDPGNERADELVQWGKGRQLYSRLQVEGEREGQGWQTPVADYEARRESRIAAKAAARAQRKQQRRERQGVSLAGMPERGSPKKAAAQGRPEGMGSRRRDAANADRFSTVGMRAAVDALENEPDISWQLGELLGVREEEEEEE